MTEQLIPKTISNLELGNFDLFIRNRFDEQKALSAKDYADFLLTQQDEFAKNAMWRYSYITGIDDHSMDHAYREATILHHRDRKIFSDGIRESWEYTDRLKETFQVDWSIEESELTFPLIIKCHHHKHFLYHICLICDELKRRYPSLENIVTLRLSDTVLIPEGHWREQLNVIHFSPDIAGIKKLKRELDLSKTAFICLNDLPHSYYPNTTLKDANQSSAFIGETYLYYAVDIAHRYSQFLGAKQMQIFSEGEGRFSVKAVEDMPAAINLVPGEWLFWPISHYFRRQTLRPSDTGLAAAS